jgi:hypothetical protein
MLPRNLSHGCPKSWLFLFLSGLLGLLTRFNESLKPCSKHVTQSIGYVKLLARSQDALSLANGKGQRASK